MSRAIMMTTALARRGELAVLTVRGELDMSTRDDLVEAVAAALRDPTRRLQVDVSLMRYCDSVGLATFVGLRKAARAEEKDVYITNVNEEMAQILRLTGLVEFLTTPDKR